MRTTLDQALAAISLFALLAACGTSTPVVEADANAEAAPIPNDCHSDSGATPQEGGGYCCPVILYAGHWCNGPPVGGWVLDPACCSTRSWEDQAYVPGVDGHGCPILVPDNDEHHCCNCPCAFHAESCSDYEGGSPDSSADAQDGTDG